MESPIASSVGYYVLPQLECVGDERALEHCPRPAGASCTSLTAAQVTCGPSSLTGSYSPSGRGGVFRIPMAYQMSAIAADDQRHMIVDNWYAQGAGDDSSRRIAGVMCRAVGLPPDNAQPFITQVHSRGYEVLRYAGYLSCTGSEQDLSSCPGYYLYNPYSWSASVVGTLCSTGTRTRVRRTTLLDPRDRPLAHAHAPPQQCALQVRRPLHPLATFKSIDADSGTGELS